MLGAIFGAGISGALGIGSTVLNNILGAKTAQQSREENYRLNEMAAQNADARTRALYKDLYSPQAMLKQYQEAGLSPSIMYGGTPGQGGMSGAQGSGTAGQPTPYMPISLLEAAEISKLITETAKTKAETEKTKAETSNINKDTDLKELQEEWQQMANSQYKTEFTILNTGFQMPDGSTKSYYDIAGDYNSYAKFIEACKEAALNAGDQEIIQRLNSEQGQRVMRAIYLAKHEFSHNISVLSSNKVSADFQKSVLEAMKEESFQEWNAKAAIAYLRQNVETSKLDETQKKAWNDIIDTLKAKNSTMADIAIILGMVVNQAMSTWHMPSINNYNTTDNSVRTFNVK